MSSPPGVGALRLASALLVGLGVVSRLAPLADAGGRLLRQFPSEDGYLMLTMARNIALGHGMSIAGGTIPTNGTQPLATYLYAAGFWVVGGDREAGVAVAHVIQLVVGAAAAFLLYRLGRRVFGATPVGDGLAAFTAALWFAAPLTLRHSMNHLETGLYALCVVAVALAVTAPSLLELRRPALGRWAAIGALLGVSFWARNDAVLLCGAVGIAHLAGALPGPAMRLRERFGELVAAGAATAAVAAPWLASNWLRFGSIMPVSGHAESMHVDFAHNLWRVPVKLFEHLVLVLPFPAALEQVGLVIAATAALLVVVAGAVAVATRDAGPVVRGLVVVGGLYTFALATFYGLTFGAGHFMSRYLFPASPLLALVLVGGAVAFLQRAPEPARRGLATAAVGAACLLALGLDVRAYVQGTRHDHFQVVQWVEENVPEDVWVGAIQTGTLGFFHDRTINLDGKVNPAALEARSEHRIPAYVVESPIQYLVDWSGIAGWIEKPPLDEEFELLLVDEQRNLAVLARRNGSR